MAAEDTHDMKLVLTASGLDIDIFRCNLFPVFSIVRRFAAARKLMLVSSTWVHVATWNQSKDRKFKEKAEISNIMEEVG